MLAQMPAGRSLMMAVRCVASSFGSSVCLRRNNRRNDFGYGIILLLLHIHKPVLSLIVEQFHSVAVEPLPSPLASAALSLCKENA